MPPSKGTHNSIKTEFKRGNEHSAEWKVKHSKRMSGDKNPAWKGGISSSNNYLSWIKNKRNRTIKRLKKEGASHTFGEWEVLKAQYNWTCPCCKASEPKVKLTEDHIIPISKGGCDNIENIQPLCMSCNLRKSTRTIKY